MREVVPGDEVFKRSYLHLVVRFDLKRAGGKVTREAGEVVAEKWLGFTARGKIPEYELTVLGKTGKTVLVRLVEDHVQEI